ncbi:sodium:proton antiporter [Geomonas limicola]|uniref:Sodium:proton antiporter n=1 Tax=Geomonas limicola TaxID=2740186 RepID=A0A6V8NEJ0_9BACT|nr:sodium:proton antiporter [Geomonas limicola]GFO70224.1 sodium:proton antiporter [Geomonas limicola]
MQTFHLIGILTTLAAGFGLINYHLLRLPTTIGLMLQSLVCSVLLLVLQAAGIPIAEPVRQALAQIDFDQLLLEGLLSFLLFAGALFVKNEELLEVKWDIAVFATVGVLISTGLIGGMLWWACRLFELPIRPLYCFLFGALISPTDPVAVLPILRAQGISRQLDAQIAGEALFNDGIGIVLFLTLLTLSGGAAVHGSDVVWLLVKEAAGGLGFGALLGWIGYRLMKSVDNYQLEILITLALVSGGYALALLAGVSGALAMVVAGLLVGGPGRRLAMSKRTRDNLDRFWELVEELLNSVLFTLIGLEMLAIVTRIDATHILAALLSIPLVLLARMLSVGSIRILLRCFGSLIPHSWPIMTWSGLRGGISIALALSLPRSGERSVVLVATYAVVAFSILVQGSTLKYLVAWRTGRNG